MKTISPGERVIGRTKGTPGSVEGILISRFTMKGKPQYTIHDDGKVQFICTDIRRVVPFHKNDKKRKT